jgi:hypothetical protein
MLGAKLLCHQFQVNRQTVTKFALTAKRLRALVNYGMIKLKRDRRQQK